MKRLILIGLLFLLLDCGRRSYRFSDAFDEGIPAGMEQLHVDSSYCLYRREVFKEMDPRSNEFRIRENTTLSDEPGKLVEVEYLMISTRHKNVIYVTTIPDSRQVYYEKNKLPKDIVNIQDFNTFHFGKLTEPTEIQFLFPDKRSSNTWELHHEIDNNKTLSLKRVTFKVDGLFRSETRADQSLADTIRFQRVGKFTLVLSKPVKKNEERKVFSSRDNILYVKEKKSSYELYFRFNDPIHRNDSAVVFKGKLIRHTPTPLLVN